MRSRIANDYDPGTTTRAVMPIFALESRRIIALVNISSHRALGQSVRVGPLDGRVAEIAELLCVAGSAMGAGEAHRIESYARSVKVRLGAHALFVDEMARRESVEAITGGGGVRLVGRD
jgi:hypothetical protein